MRRLSLLAVFGALVCANLLAQTRTAVHGMSQYTETTFRFSFWYPAAWKLTHEPVNDPAEHGWFPDATIVKELQIRNSAESVEGDQPPGVTLLELFAPAGLTELGKSQSASPVGEDGRYLFDSGARRWTYTRSLGALDGARPETVPVEITHRTMGGLPIFPGALRHGGEVIVPLDASHFIAIRTLDIGGYPSHTYLAETIMATDPYSGKRGNSQLQAKTIRREAVKLRAIGEAFGFWYKDGQHVYNYNGEILHGADPKRFVSVSRAWRNASFATDGVRVYGSFCGVIPGADPKTFAATGEFSATDARHAYDCSSGSVKTSGVPPRK